ncbi:Spy/CpxP family protein refolding chaperone [Pontibacter sp. JAM-7]|uniref:Spy/CpxP family protein refolding chaperone n=1 Tax=Pontibacter sp. JAM-7 TaxID=3366581 RepID=UPI003AF6F60D
MNKKLLIGLTAAVIITGSTTAAFAYDKHEDKEHYRGSHKIEHLSEQLALTEAQKTSLKQTFKENYSKMKDGMRQHKSHHHALRQLNPTADNYEAELDKLIAEAQANAKERVMMRAEHQKEIFQTLTPEQQEKLTAMTKERPEGKHHKHSNHYKGCDR